MPEKPEEYIKCGEYGCFWPIGFQKGNCLNHICLVDYGAECHLSITKSDAEEQARKQNLEECAQTPA